MFSVKQAFPVAILLGGLGGHSFAQQAAPPSAPPYGAPISYEVSNRMMVAAANEANRNQWAMVIAIVDSTAHLTSFQKLDGAQHASVELAIGKAMTSVNFRTATKGMQDAIAAGGAGLRVLALPNATPLEGGSPIVADGRIIGAIGISGGTPAQESQVARAALEASVK